MSKEVDASEKADELFRAIKSECALTDKQAQWCSQDCLQRYLRAREGNVKEAAKLLQKTLTWRESFKVDEVHKIDFSDDIATGRMYIAGNDEEGHSVLVTRKRSDKIQDSEHEKYLQYLVYNLETAVRAMQAGKEKWIWIMDMKGYSRANSPPLNVSMQTLHILADYYPERLEKCYVVDAPIVFFVLWKALSPFIHHVTRSKVEFLQGSDFATKVEKGEMPKSHAQFYATDVSVEDTNANLARWWTA